SGALERPADGRAARGVSGARGAGGRRGYPADERGAEPLPDRTGTETAVYPRRAAQRVRIIREWHPQIWRLVPRRGETRQRCADSAAPRYRADAAGYCGSLYRAAWLAEETGRNAWRRIRRHRDENDVMVAGLQSAVHAGRAGRYRGA